MTLNGARPELDLVEEIRLRCKDLAGVIELDEADFFDKDGKPIEVYDMEGNQIFRVPKVFRRRCKNLQCCPRMAGHMPIHRWILMGTVQDVYGVERGVGEYITEYVPDKNPSEILGQGARTNGTGNTRRASV